MQTVYNFLAERVNIREIIKITQHGFDLDVEETLEKMKMVDVDNILPGMIFWTQNSNIVVGYENATCYDFVGLFDEFDF